MTFPIRLARRIRETLDMMRAARAVASAVEANRRPVARDLDRLGIDRDAFPRVG